MSDRPTRDGGQQLFFGVYPALVTDIVDPDSLGRIKIKLPILSSASEVWATLISPYAEDDQGLMILPETGTQVLVAFEAGNLRRPYILGAAWNGAEATPTAPEEANNLRVLKTRSGHILEFDDTEGSSKVTLTTAGGHTLEMDDGGLSVTLSHSSGHVITLTAAGAVEVTANSTVDISATAMNVHAPVATFDGIVKCTTLMASASVTSPMYSPGVGNLW